MLYFADGTTAGGIWTGQRWWSQGQAVYPIRWRRLSPEPPAARPAADSPRMTAGE